MPSFSWLRRNDDGEFGGGVRRGEEKVDRLRYLDSGLVQAAVDGSDGKLYGTFRYTLADLQIPAKGTQVEPTEKPGMVRACGGLASPSLL